MNQNQIHSEHTVRPPQTRWQPSLRATVVIAFCLAVSLAFTSQAQEDGADQRLLDQRPFDHIQLNDANKTLLKVEPLEFPDRKVPLNNKPTDQFSVRLFDNLDQEYRIRWRDIEEITLFEEMLLTEAQQLVEAGKFNEAFDYLLRIKKIYPQLEGLEDTLQNFLYEEAKKYQSKQDYERAFVLLLQLESRNPSNPRLPVALGATTGKLVENYVAQENYPAARRMLNELASKFPEQQTVITWRGRLGDMAAKLVSTAREQMEGGDLSAAQESVRRAIEIWPFADETRELYEEIHARYPFVPVGVHSVSKSAPATAWLYDWAARRTRNLVSRPLAELQGFGAEGGRYASAYGDLIQGDLGLLLTARLKAGTTWSDGKTPLTGYDVVRNLRTMANPNSEDYEPQWGRLVDSISVRNVYNVDIRLRRGHVRPESLLTSASLQHWSSDDSDKDLVTGPYGIVGNEENQTTFAVTKDASSVPSKLVEQHYPDSKSAITALERGEIGVLDRVNPWDVARVAAIDQLNVEPYAVPTIHCLIPNPNRPLSSSRSFRRALTYGIDRQRILHQRLLREREEPGSMVISGPIVRGAASDDPRGYGYNPQVETREFDPRMALTLATVGITEATAALAKKEQTAPEKFTISIGHAPTEVATAACEEIARYIQLLGVDVELHALDSEINRAALENFDFLYAELAQWEPITDLWRLLGPAGIAPGASPYVALALRQLEMADNWPDARQQLFELHRLIHDDVSVVPLWQLTDYFAFHDRVKGIGSRPVALYQHINQWKVAPWYPSDVE